jgi:hypothetical protein
MAIEIVDFRIKNSDFPSFFVCLPEGMSIANVSPSQLNAGTQQAAHQQRTKSGLLSLPAPGRTCAWRPAIFSEGVIMGLYNGCSTTLMD